MDNKNNVGRRLKEAREKKSLTIEQVQKQTKIHSSVLKALEDGRASDLLTDTYVRSFLKKYCQLLGLPSSDILKEYFPPRAEAPLLGKSPVDNPLPEETKVDPKVLYFTGAVILGIAAFIMVVIMGAKLVSSFGKARQTHVERRVEAASAAKKKQAKPAAKTASKKKTAARTASDAKDIIPKSEKLNLTIKVKEPVMVSLKRDGVVIYTTIMNKGTVDRVTADESIELGVLKTGALDLNLNGQQIELPPKKNIRGIIITRKGVRLK